MARQIKSLVTIPWPNEEISENFTFSAIDGDGVFTFHFKWINDRWNCWIDMPDGTTRQAGVYPNVLSWSQFLDYSLIFMTDLTQIDYNHLFMTEINLVKWQ